MNDENCTSCEVPLTLNQDNFQQGYLMDEDWMAGVTLQKTGEYDVFVLNHQTSGVISFTTFPSLETALGSLNDFNRKWTYESFAQGGCAGKSCSTGKCNPKGCKKRKNSPLYIQSIQIPTE